MNGRLVPSTSPCRRPTSTFTVWTLGLKARRTARDRNLKHGQCSGAGASFCLHSGRKWRGRGRRCAVESGDLPRCCSTCRRSIRSIWPSYRKWTAQVRECGVLAAGTARGQPGTHGLLTSVAVVAEFGRIAVEFLRRGSNPKIYEGAASKKGRRQALPVELESAIHSLSISPAGTSASPRVLDPLQPILHSCQSGRKLCK